MFLDHNQYRVLLLFIAAYRRYRVFLRVLC